MYQQPAKDNRASGKNDGDNLLLDSFTLKQTWARAYMIFKSRPL